MKRFCALVLLFAVLLIPASAVAGENMSPSGDGYVLSGGWIYFRAVSGDEYALCRMREDMTGLEKLTDSSGYSLSVARDRLYFITDEIRRIGTNGGGEQALAKAGDWDSGLISTGDYVYVRSEDRILRYRADPWKKVGSIPVRKTASRFQIADGWIYLSASDETPRFYRVRTDGSGRETWYEAPGSGSLTMWSVSGDRIYYGIRDSSKGTAQLRRVHLDGTGDELLLEGLWTIWIWDGWAYGTKFLPEPEITTAEESFDGVETRSYDTLGAYRVNLETGESQYLGDYDIFGMRPVGGLILLEEDDAWSEEPPEVIHADGTAAGVLPRLPG